MARTQLGCVPDADRYGDQDIASYGGQVEQSAV
jgi:hypothetical protein